MLGEGWRVHAVVRLLEVSNLRLLGEDFRNHRNLDRYGLLLLLCWLGVHGLVSLLQFVDMFEYLHTMEPRGDFHIVLQIVLGDVLYHLAIEAETSEYHLVLWQIQAEF